MKNKHIYKRNTSISISSMNICSVLFIMIIVVVKTKIIMVMMIIIIIKRW